MKLTTVSAMVFLATLANDANPSTPEKLLAEARKAIGGADRLSAVQTILATGKSRRQLGDMQIEGDVEVAIALPDKYLRTHVDTMMGATVTRELGFSGDEPLEHTASLGGGNVLIRTGRPGDDPARARQALLQAQKQELARLVVAWLLAAPSYAEATFTYAGEAESPDGRADVLDVKGAGGLAFRLFVDRATHRPLMISYQGREPVMRTVRMRPEDRPAQHGPGAAPSDARVEAPAAPLVEIQWFLDDFRKVGDIWLPHRLSRSAEGKTTEEWEFTRFRINEPIKDDKFSRR